MRNRSSISLRGCVELNGVELLVVEVDVEHTIITGASKGIGQTTAQHGANVVLTARRQPELDEAVAGIAAAGGKAIGVLADSADPKAPKLVFGKTIEAFGKGDTWMPRLPADRLARVYCNPGAPVRRARWNWCAGG